MNYDSIKNKVIKSTDSQSVYNLNTTHNYTMLYDALVLVLVVEVEVEVEVVERSELNHEVFHILIKLARNCLKYVLQTDDTKVRQIKLISFEHVVKEKNKYINIIRKQF